jgi:putative salt-induced outer membrane protein YdiY
MRIETRKHLKGHDALVAVTLIICLLSAIPGAFAQGTLETRRFKDEAEIAAINTTGNTDVLTLSLKNTLTYDFSNAVTGRWNLLALYGEQSGEKNAGRYSTDLRGDYSLNPRRYLYLLGGWLRDEFAGFSNRYSVGPGIGHKFLVGSKHFMSAELGANLTREEYVIQEAENFIEARIYGEYEYIISERNKLSQSLEYLHDLKDSTNFKILSMSTVTSALTDILAIRIAY